MRTCSQMQRSAPVGSSTEADTEHAGVCSAVVGGHGAGRPETGCAPPWGCPASAAEGRLSYRPASSV